MPTVKRSDVSKAITVPESPVPIMSDELMVLLKEGQSEDQFIAALGALPVRIVGRMPLFRMLQVEVPEDRREELRQSLGALGPVEAVTYQSIGKTYQSSSDLVFTNNDPKDDWNLKAINALEAWETTRGHPNVAIAILDAGTLIEHEELEGKIIRPASGLSEDGVTQLNYKVDNSPAGHKLDHGTHVAITAAGLAGNSRGTAGVCPKCLVIPVQVNFSVAQTAAGLEYAIRNGARVVNMSYGSHFPYSYRSGFADQNDRPGAERFMLSHVRRNQPFINVIMQKAEASGVVMVPAAGNQNLPGAFMMMCRHRYSLCAGAAGIYWKGPLKGRLKSAGFSNYGHFIDISAPGMSIFSGVSGPGTGTYRSYGGTSMAAPHVSGLAGLLFAFNPKLTARDVRRIIRASARFHGREKPDGLTWAPAQDRAEREVYVWHRAALRLLGKDETKLLPKPARVILAQAIPRRWNTLRDWPYDIAPGKTIGPFIDAQAALKMAKAGNVDDLYAEFTQADLKALAEIDGEKLIRLADLLRWQGAYAAGGENTPAFRLAPGPEADRLVVTRKDENPEAASETFIYQSPGSYLHQARAGGEDYGRGPVRLRWRGDKLQIEDLIRRKEVAYALE